VFPPLPVPSPADPPVLPPEDPPLLPPDDPPVFPADDVPVLTVVPSDPSEEEPSWPPDLSEPPEVEAWRDLVSLTGGCSAGRGEIPASTSVSASASGAVLDELRVPASLWNEGPESIPPEIIQPTSRPATMLRAMAPPTVGMPTRDPGGCVRYM
jgi:hypothetical protein